MNHDLRATDNWQQATANWLLRSTKVYVRNYKLFMQNKANFRKSQMNVNKVLTKDYEQKDTWSNGKTKPIQSQFKANSNPIKAKFKKAKMNVTSIITKAYENISNWAICENKPNSNPNIANFRIFQNSSFFQLFLVKINMLIYPIIAEIAFAIITERALL